MLLLVLTILPIHDAARISSRTSDEEAIRAAEGRDRLSLLHRDYEQLRRGWSERLVVNAPDNRVLVGPATVLNMKKAGGGDYSSLERTIEQISVYEDVAIVMGAETVQPGSGPHTGQTIHRRFTNVWKKNGGSWSLIARHISNICS